MLVCWDYNDTIVGRKGVNEIVRPNFKQVAEASKLKGYVHVITSTLIGKHVEEEIKKNGIDSVVERVFGERRGASRSSKVYADVVKAFKIDDAAKDVVVIGDKAHDHPGDLEKVVFIMNPEGNLTDAQIVYELLEILRSGTDNFYQGFLRLKTSSFDLTKECSFIYHGRIHIQTHSAVVLSTFNGSPWPTPTLLLTPKEQAEEFEKLEVK